MSNTNTEITIADETAVFELVQRQAKLLASSTLVPKEFQGNMANCAIGLNIAKRLGADSFMVLQNIDIIHGRPSFRATFLIAMVNASGRFTPLQFLMSGEGPNRSCFAHCKVKETGEVVEGPEISMAMAKAEGWSTKAGSKWLTMPELMLRYRAAAFFARIYAPDITLGMQTSEESADLPSEPRQTKGRVVEPENLGTTKPAPRNPYVAALPDPEPTPAAEVQGPPAAPQDEPNEESAPIDSNSPRGTLVFFEKMEIAHSPENASKPWTKYTVHYTVPNGPVKAATTFSESMVAPLTDADEGVQIRIETEPAVNPKHADKLTFLVIAEGEGW